MSTGEQPSSHIRVTTDFMVSTLNTLIDAQKRLINIYDNSLEKKEQILASRQLALDGANKRANDAEMRVAQLSRQVESLAAQLAQAQEASPTSEVSVETTEGTVPSVEPEETLPDNIAN